MPSKDSSTGAAVQHAWEHYAELIRASVLQGDKLQTAAKEAETRRQRLEELAADLAAAKAAATEAERVHHEHVAALEPLRRRHRRSTVRSLRSLVVNGEMGACQRRVCPSWMSTVEPMHGHARPSCPQTLRCFQCVFWAMKRYVSPASLSTSACDAQTVAQKLEADLTVIQRKRAELEALEAQYAKDLQAARAVQEGDASQIAALEPVVQGDVRPLAVLTWLPVLCMLCNSSQQLCAGILCLSSVGVADDSFGICPVPVLGCRVLPLSCRNAVI